MPTLPPEAAKVPDEVDDFLERWHRFVSERDPALLDPLLAEDISLGAPPYWGRLRGRETVQHLLGLIVQTIEGFTYHRQWRDGRELALEFTGRVGKLELQGIDLITLDESGAIQKLDVLMRPRDAIESLQETITPRMQAFLAERSGGGA
jgi:hypothetical protein